MRVEVAERSPICRLEVRLEPDATFRLEVRLEPDATFRLEVRLSRTFRSDYSDVSDVTSAAFPPTINRVSVARRSLELALPAAEPDPPTHDVKRQEHQCKDENDDVEREGGDVHVAIIGMTLSDFRQTPP